MSSSRDDWHIRDKEYEQNKIEAIILTPFEQKVADILYHERNGRSSLFDCQKYSKNTLSPMLLELAKNN